MSFGMKRFFALALMLIAWLLYGAMPALAVCPMCGADRSSPAAMAAQSAAADMSGMHTSAVGLEGHMAHHDDPCSGEPGHASFCAACLIVLPAGAVEMGRPLAFSYPVPALSDPLRDNGIQPLAPPPRSI
jgi:hypothetical protein